MTYPQRNHGRKIKSTEKNMNLQQLALKSTHENIVILLNKRKEYPSQKSCLIKIILCGCELLYNGI